MVVGRGEKEGGKARKGGGWGRCNIICAGELFFFTLSDFEIWDVRFLPTVALPLLRYYCPSDFPIILQPTKPWMLIP